MAPTQQVYTEKQICNLFAKQETYCRCSGREHSQGQQTLSRSAADMHPELVLHPPGWWVLDPQTPFSWSLSGILPVTLTHSFRESLPSLVFSLHHQLFFFALLQRLHRLCPQLSLNSSAVPPSFRVSQGLSHNHGHLAQLLPSCLQSGTRSPRLRLSAAPDITISVC